MSERYVIKIDSVIGKELDIQQFGSTLYIGNVDPKTEVSFIKQVEVPIYTVDELVKKAKEEFSGK